MKYITQGKKFWLDEVLDALFAYLEKCGIPPDAEITCAAGMTPSCPIHFGIFREIFISHYVCEEIKKRGRKARLIFYWDDYDHFCKIPYFTVKDKVKEHIWKPLVEVPDFQNAGNAANAYPSYGEHYMRVFEEGIASLGIQPEYNYQSAEYACGKYAEYIRLALRKRNELYAIIHDVIKNKPDDNKEQEYYPLEVYCRECGRDTTRVSGYDEEKDIVSYECKSCSHNGSYVIGGDFHGKLIWKANWAMRWMDDRVLFESSGENHLTETGSYAVASRISNQIFGGFPAFSLLYRFIGVPGIAKVSRAQGEKSLSSRLVNLVESAIVHWLFLKNSPDKPMTIDLDKGLKRIYSEWDSFAQNCKNGNATEENVRIFKYATENTVYCDLGIPFSSVVAATGISCGDREKTTLLLFRTWASNMDYGQFREHLHPRFQCARYAIYTYNMSEDVPVPRTTSAAEEIEMTPVIRNIIESLIQELDTVKTETGIQELLYNLPKIAMGIAPAEKQNPEVKSLQLELYKTLYILLLGKENGPKLATILSLMDYSQIKYLLKNGEK